MSATLPDPSTASQASPATHKGRPRWVKVLVIGAIAAIALVVALMLLGGGNHGPGRHLGSGEDGQPPSGVSEDHMPPAGLEGHSPPAGILDHGTPQP